MTRLELERFCTNLGISLGEKLPSGIGFTFVLFDFGERGNVAYLSNANRDDMARVLRELADNLDAHEVSS